MLHKYTDVLETGLCHGEAFKTFILFWGGSKFMSPLCPLLVFSSLAGRLMAEPFSHHVSCTVIGGRGLSFQTVHLKVQSALGIVSGDRKLALHRVCVQLLITIDTIDV